MKLSPQEQWFYDLLESGDRGYRSTRVMRLAYRDAYGKPAGRHLFKVIAYSIRKKGLSVVGDFKGWRIGDAVPMRIGLDGDTDPERVEQHHQAPSPMQEVREGLDDDRGATRSP